MNEESPPPSNTPEMAPTPPVETAPVEAPYVMTAENPNQETENIPTAELKRRVLVLCLYAGRRALILLMVIGLLVLGIGILNLLSSIHLVAGLTAIATLLAYVLAPAVNYLHERKINRIAAIVLVYLGVALLVVIALAFVIPVVREQYVTFTSNLTHYFADLQNNLRGSLASLSKVAPPPLKPMIDNIDPDTLSLDSLSSELQNSLPKIVGGGLSGVFTGVKTAVVGITSMVLIPLFSFYMLMDSKRYHDGFLRLMPRRWKADTAELMLEVNQVLGKYIRGQLIVCCTVGIAISIVLNCAHLEYATLLGVFGGVIDIIPYVGVAMGMIPALLIASVNHSFLYVVMIFVLMETVHWLEGHIIVPAVIGHSVGLPPLVVMIALGAGAELGGIMGMVLAIPIAAILRVLCVFYVRKLEQFELNEPIPGVQSTIDPKKEI